MRLLLAAMLAFATSASWAIKPQTIRQSPLRPISAAQISFRDGQHQERHCLHAKCTCWHMPAHAACQCTHCCDVGDSSRSTFSHLPCRPGVLLERTSTAVVCSFADSAWPPRASLSTLPSLFWHTFFCHTEFPSCLHALNSESKSLLVEQHFLVAWCGLSCLVA